VRRRCVVVKSWARAHLGGIPGASDRAAPMTGVFLDN